MQGGECVDSSLRFIGTKSIQNDMNLKDKKIEI